MPDEVSHHFSDPVILMNTFNIQRTRLSPALCSQATPLADAAWREDRQKDGQDAIHSGQQPLPEKPSPASCYRHSPASVDLHLLSGNSPRRQNSCLDQSPKSHGLPEGRLPAPPPLSEEAVHSGPSSRASILNCPHPKLTPHANGQTG